MFFTNMTNYAIHGYKVNALDHTVFTRLWSVKILLGEQCQTAPFTKHGLINILREQKRKDCR